jgi:hypothetical protein
VPGGWTRGWVRALPPLACCIREIRGKNLPCDHLGKEIVIPAGRPALEPQ